MAKLSWQLSVQQEVEYFINAEVSRDVASSLGEVSREVPEASLFTFFSEIHSFVTTYSFFMQVRYMLLHSVGSTKYCFLFIN